VRAAHIRLAIAAAVLVAPGAAFALARPPAPTQAASPLAPAGTPAVVARNLAAWPAPNHDYASTRDAATTRLGSRTIRKLRVAWRYPLSGSGLFGVFASNPIVTASRVYLQTTSSTVVALDRRTGAPVWTYALSEPNGGPNGPALGDGIVVAVGKQDVFALDAATGRLRWSKTIARKGIEGIDMAPLVWRGLVIVSSAPGGYHAGGKGIVYALDAATGEEHWHFDTTTDDLWGHPEVNSGGGLWYPPSVDGKGRLYLGVGNPAPFPGTPAYPDGSSRPGRNLYTDSLVVLDGLTGKLLWYFQAVRHDLRDYDLQLPPILTTATIRGARHDVAVVGGKGGTIYALDRGSGALLWKRAVGIHNAWSRSATFPAARLPITVYPGPLGGVIAPMASSGGAIYATVVDLCGIVVSQDPFPEGERFCPFDTGRGEVVALSVASGKQLWKRSLPEAAYAGTTVAGDLVLTATFGGRLYAFAKGTGRTVFTLRLPAGTNALPAVTADGLVIGAGTKLTDADTPAVVAYRLP
jgi:outer membrane protein assembly factor BamB